MEGGPGVGDVAPEVAWYCGGGVGLARFPFIRFSQR